MQTARLQAGLHMLRATFRSTMQMATRHCTRPVCSSIRPVPSAQPKLSCYRPQPNNISSSVASHPRIGALILGLGFVAALATVFALEQSSMVIRHSGEQSSKPFGTFVNC